MNLLQTTAGCALVAALFFLLRTAMSAEPVTGDPAEQAVPAAQAVKPAAQAVKPAAQAVKPAAPSVVQARPKRPIPRIPAADPEPSTPPGCDTCPDLVVESCKLYCIKNGDTWLTPPECPSSIDPAAYSSVEIRGIVRNASTRTGTYRAGIITDTLRDAAPGTTQIGANRSIPETWISAGYEFERQGWFTVSIPATLPLGTHTSVVRVDPTNSLQESNETNNFCAMTWNRIGTVVVPTDLQVSAVAVSPASGPPETPFQFLVTVRNASGPTAPTFTVSCDRGSTWPTVSGLAVGQSRQVAVPISTPFPPGSRKVTCTADSQQKVLDVNRGNNSGSVTFTVTQP